MTSLTAVQVWTVVGMFLIFNSGKVVSGLWCYKCSETTKPPPSHAGNATHSGSTKPTPPCSRFDPYSNEFQVECQDSTFCMKKTFQLQLQNGQTVRSESRSCAPQSYNYHSYSEGVGWTVKKAMEDSAYEHGCHIDTANPARVKVPSTEHCYCSTHLCNSASSNVLRGGGSSTKSGAGGETSGARGKGGSGPQGLGERVVEAGRRAGEVVGKTVAAAAHHTDAMAVIIVFNAVKYIRSLR